MQSIHKMTGGIILFGLAVCLAALPERAVSSSSSETLGGAGLAQSSSNEPVPAFHSEAPTGPLPATMDPTLFSDPVVKNAYTVAARIKKVLYQEPCYCHCDVSQGHGSLLDCFVSKHGAGCGVCIQEDFYSYEQSHRGKTAAQIREGIQRGDWHALDLSKYENHFPHRRIDRASIWRPKSQIRST